MRVYTPPPRPSQVRRPSRRATVIEFAGLAAATVAVVAGLWLTASGRLQSVEVSQADVTSGRILHLPSLRSAAALTPRLAMIAVPFEREAVARALYARATALDPPIENVGALAAVTIPAAVVRADRRFVALRERLDRRPELDRVPALTAAELAAFKTGVVVRTPEEFRNALQVAALLFFAAFWIAHAFRWSRPHPGDPLLLPLVLLLCGLGLMSMVSLRDPLRDTFLAYRFAQGVVAGVGLLAVLSLVDFEASRLRRAVTLPLGLALTLAVMLLVFGDGPGSSGAKVNLLGAQPVEAIRLLVVFALAAYFGSRVDVLREYSEPATTARPWLRRLRVPRWRDIVPVFVAMGLVLAFFFLQKDLGPALVLTIVFLGLYSLARGKLIFVVVSLGLLFGAFALAYRLGYPPTVGQRVAMWLDPWANTLPGGNQIAQGYWALASGAFWGAGGGLGDPQLVPAAHTDFVLTALGEEFGWVGLATIVALYALLIWRCIRAALRAPGDYTAILATGVALSLIVQAVIIASGLLGLLPLSGVVTPFLSFGRSSMLVNCAAIGIALAISRRAGPPRALVIAPLRTISHLLVAAAVVLVARAAWIQVVHADRFASVGSLTEQADGGLRFEYNPRLVDAARVITRGTIYDRNGLPLATSRADEMSKIADAYRAAHVRDVGVCQGSAPRCYPLGPPAFHVIGEATRQTNWAARNTSYVERDADAELKGYDDRATLVSVRNRRTGTTEQIVKRDYVELLPLLRNRHRPEAPAVKAILDRPRDVTISLDARLQARAAAAMRNRVQAGKLGRGAAVVMDVETGQVLASVSYPWPGAAELEGGGTRPDVHELLDRPRYGLYPPGSTFKLVVAAAALRASSSSQAEPLMCVRLPDGRVGNYVRGQARPVRDDPMDRTPHGSVELRQGLVMSCNAYFAQLAQRLGTRPLMETASLLQIDMSRRPTEAGLRSSLPHAGYGQGEVVVSPIKMARVVAAIARQGRIPAAQWRRSAAPEPANEASLLPAADAATLAAYMREVVTSGTGRVLSGHPIPIAGKTGTAEVDGAAAHSWFVGYAPYGNGAGRKIAFAVILENAGYGARAAAPLAGDLVTAAQELGLFSVKAPDPQ
jgi:cell division protein FtsW (lipid II flippase)